MTETNEARVDRRLDPPSSQDDGRRARAARSETAGGEEALVDEELLVEEVSIDGMCGVY